ncbi:DivIVA domain-containing protein [Microbacterium halophytorum]|uniref:DivIVA domain-containing protein n=1 Tax=Microbacterium halophytorum TaxID=2067568 RepID=UPI000CFC657C|nr:DivIVA domain-containing protein [Microbacterium halophytorum]
MSDTATIDSGAEAGAPKKLPFPVTHGRERGYDRRQVEEFMARARAAFEAGGADEPGALTAEDVRRAAFTLTKKGFEVEAVDQALGRIEEAFAARERRRAIDSEGPNAWVDRARDEAQVILDHLDRPAKHRFARVGAFSHGYAPDEVDAVADRITEFLQLGTPLEAEQVRQAAFRVVRRGYREEQVDALLDAVVEIILAVR